MGGMIIPAQKLPDDFKEGCILIIEEWDNTPVSIFRKLLNLLLGK